MVDQSTAKYLSENIGGVLAKALGDMAIVQPRDSVDYLAKYLQLYVDQEEGRKAQEEMQLKLIEDRALAQEKLAQMAAKKAAKEQEQEKKEAVYQDLLKKLNDPGTTFSESFWSELLTAASTLTGAKAAYLGLVDEEGLEETPGPLIRYVQASAGAEAMKEKLLMPGQGVTWGAVTENPNEEVPYLWKPPQPVPIESNPDDPDAPAEPVPTLSYYPVSIECVTDVKEMHYFEMTRLGAYLAVPLIYSSYYTQEASAACRTFEEEKKAEQKKRAEAEEAYAAALEEAQGNEEAVTVEKPPELDGSEEKEMTLPGKTVKMVLCLDTLGTNTAINEACFERALELCEAFGKCKQETEKKLLDDQVVFALNETERAAMDEKIAEARERAVQETQETEQADEAEVPPEEEGDKELVGKKWAYLRATRVFLELKDLFFSMKSWVVTTPEVINLIAATAFFLGYKKEELYPKGKVALDWIFLREILDEKFLKAVKDLEPSEPRKGLDGEHRMAAIKVMKGADFDTEKVQEVSPALEVLHAFLNAALEYRTTSLMNKKAAYEKLKEAEGEEFNQPPLEEEDDDFEGL